MKAVFITGVRKTEVKDIPAPEIKQPDEVLLKTRVAGICGSDLHYFISDHVGGEPVPYPCLVGHECAAEVVAAGKVLFGWMPSLLNK